MEWSGVDSAKTVLTSRAPAVLINAKAGSIFPQWSGMNVSMSVESLIEVREAVLTNLTHQGNSCFKVQISFYNCPNGDPEEQWSLSHHQLTIDFIERFCP